MRFSKGYDADKEKDTGLDKMSMEMESLFKLFLENNNKFNPNKSFSALKKYFKKYERIIYAPISNFIFMDIDRIEDDERDILGTIYSNIDKTYEYAKKQTSDNEQEQEIISKIVIALIKMRDHVDLASNQYKSLKQSDDEFKRKFKMIIKPVQDKMERKISSQLISLVGIFTAMAFLIFGGISVIGEIAYGFQNASMIKLIMITSLWGLCIINRDTSDKKSGRERLTGSLPLFLIYRIIPLTRYQLIFIRAKTNLLCVGKAGFPFGVRVRHIKMIMIFFIPIFFEILF